MNLQRAALPHRGAPTVAGRRWAASLLASPLVTLLGLTLSVAATQAAAQAGKGRPDAPAPSSSGAGRSHTGASAGDPFAGADLALGEQLIRQHQCTECHTRHLGSDGLAIYRPGLRIQDAAGLRRMVARCDTELSLSLFPEEVLAVSAVLNRDHYRYTVPH
jgi:hypothetical protein